MVRKIALSNFIDILVLAGMFFYPSFLYAGGCHSSIAERAALPAAVQETKDPLIDAMDLYKRGDFRKAYTKFCIALNIHANSYLTLDGLLKLPKEVITALAISSFEMGDVRISLIYFRYILSNSLIIEQIKNRIFSCAARAAFQEDEWELSFYCFSEIVNTKEFYDLSPSEMANAGLAANKLVARQKDQETRRLRIRQACYFFDKAIQKAGWQYSDNFDANVFVDYYFLSRKGVFCEAAHSHFECGNLWKAYYLYENSLRYFDQSNCYEDILQFQWVVYAKAGQAAFHVERYTRAYELMKKALQLVGKVEPGGKFWIAISRAAMEVEDYKVVRQYLRNAAAQDSTLLTVDEKRFLFARECKGKFYGFPETPLLESTPLPDSLLAVEVPVLEEQHGLRSASAADLRN